MRSSRGDIAIVGIGCYLPGDADGPEQFWRNLCDGVDGIVEVPDDRWSLDKYYDSRSGAGTKAITKWGGFVRDIRGFDSELFGISPREAAAMDPQQRLALQLAWHALEDAGIAADRLAGTPCGVFLGCCGSDYGALQRQRGTSDALANTGVAISIVANRISHRLDLRGPSIVVDTACSSSLVALHLACRSLIDHDCDLAITGGVNALLDPGPFVGFSQANMMSPTGKMHSFDHRANGYVRAEGGSMVVLRPLERAVAEGDRIYAVIRGTCVNQDGHTPTMTAPSMEAQAAMLRRACAAAAIEPKSVGYVEAHGTGTPVGDPIEAHAIGEVFGRSRTDGSKVLVGSVKTNVGHLESAAGATGLIKAALSLFHGSIPKNLNFERPNPAIPFDELGIAVPQSSIPFGSGSWPARAAVNSFGFGGTNACAVLEVGPSERPAKGDLGTRPARYLVPVTAATPTALRAAAAQLLDHVDSHPELTLEAIADTLANRRAHLSHRLALVVADRDELRRKLAEFVDGREPLAAIKGSLPTYLQGRRENTKPLVFVFTGQGGQWWAMGRELLAHDSLFRAEVERFDLLFAPMSGWSVIDELGRDEASSRINRTSVTQTAIFALQIALAARWRAWGIVPGLVVGHSFGELAAAHVAGAISLEDAALVIYHRGRLQQTLEGTGGMAALGLSRAQAREALDELGDASVEIAAVNGPSMVTVGGSKAGLAAALALIEGRWPGTFARMLKLEVGFHTNGMDPIEAEFRQCLAGLRPMATRIPLVSTVTAGLIDGERLDADFWWRNVREPVLFQPAIELITARGHDTFVELGPHPTLAGPISSCLAEIGIRGLVVASLNRDQPELETLQTALGTLWVHGHAPDWQGVLGPSRPFTPLPRYPFERVNYWVGSEESRAMLFDAPVHPLLGRRGAGPIPRWTNEIDLKAFPFIKDHRIDGAVLYPGAGYLEMMLAAAADLFGEGMIELEDVTLHEAMFIEDEQFELVETSFDPDRSMIRIHSRTRAGAPEWTLRASGKIAVRPVPANDLHVAEPAPSTEAPFDRQHFYELAAGRRYEYGPLFQGIERLWPGQEVSTAEIVPPAELVASTGRYLFHPAVLDSCVQTGLAPLLQPTSIKVTSGLSLPRKIARLRFISRPGEKFFARARIVHRDAGSTTLDYSMVDTDGRLLVSIEGFMMQSLAATTAAKSGPGPSLSHYQDFWHEASLDGPDSSHEPKRQRCWLVFADSGGAANAAMAKLRADGDRCVEVHRGADYRRANDNGFVVRTSDGEDMQRLLADLVSSGCKPTDVVYCWSVDSIALASADAFVAAQERFTIPLVHLVQALAQEPSLDARLWIVTRGSRLIAATDGDHPEEEALGLAQTPVAGLMRTISSEYETWRCMLIDLDPASDIHAVEAFVDELRADGNEAEVAFRGSRRLVSRLDRIEPEAMPPKLVPATSDEITAWKLTMRAAGVLDHMRVVEADRPDAGPGEILISVRAVALNFRDIMVATGLYPKELDGERSWEHLGSECAGTVVAVGSGVQRFARGDRVMTMASGSFAAELEVPADFVMAMPDWLSFTDASTVPVAFMTAYYSLVTQARLMAGERVLIHVATGGVGLAAVQIAKMIGAEIFATAGSELKRDYLRSLGIRHVMSSRTLDFADETLAATNGRGVDVVLNSLPGAFLKKGLACLAPYGRFVEIGKRDIYADNPLGLKIFRKNLTFYAVDLASIDPAQRARMRRVLDELEALLASGQLTALPTTIFPMCKVVDAFRHMSQAKHIGKVVVTLDDPELRVASSADRPMRLKADGSYLVTGGLGGFGLEVAKWLGSRGAGHLVLMGRSGAATDEAKEAILQLEQSGVKVTVAAADVTKAEDVARVMEAVRTSGKPLRGVIHGAMVIDDGFLSQLDRGRFMRVLGPKMVGAWNLHEATRGAPLDFFVMFSSVAALLGAKGQANYVAGNSFLDELAHYRRGQGLPALTINWGALGGAGFVARMETMIRYLDSTGITVVPLEIALQELGRLLRQDPVVAGVAIIDWTKIARTAGANANSPRIAHLTAVSAGTQGGRIRSEILAAPQSRREALVANFLRQQIAKVLRVEAAKIEAARPLNELGLDSLTAFEVKNRIESELSLSLPVSRFLQQPTINSLAEAVLEKLGQEAVSSDASPDAITGNQSGLSVQQEWLLRHLDNAPFRDAFVRHWDYAYAIAVKPALDEARLRTALVDITSRHGILRACFPKENGRRVVRILPTHPTGLGVFEHRDLDVAGARAMLQARADELFDLDRRPMLQLDLYRLADDTDVLLFKIHHLVFDGWSLMRIVFEMFMNYFGLSAEEEQVLEHREFVKLQRQSLDSPEGRESMAYWEEQLRDVGPQLNLPFDRPRRSALRLHGATHRFTIEPGSVEELDALAMASGASSYAVMLAGFKLTLHAYTGREDIIVPGWVTARDRRELETVIGWVANVIPFRSRIDPAATILSYLSVVSRSVREGLVHQALPIHYMLPVLDDGSPDFANPVGQVGFSMLRPGNFDDHGLGVLLVNRPDAEVQFGSLEVASVALDSDKCTRDMVMSVQEVDGRVFGSVEYDADVFDAATIQRFTDDYLTVLRGMVSMPEISVRELVAAIGPVLTTTQRAAE